MSARDRLLRVLGPDTVLDDHIRERVEQARGDEVA
jgi:hypothetical protein